MPTTPDLLNGSLGKTTWDRILGTERILTKTLDDLLVSRDTSGLGSLLTKLDEYALGGAYNSIKESQGEAPQAFSEEEIDAVAERIYQNTRALVASCAAAAAFRLHDAKAIEEKLLETQRCFQQDWIHSIGANSGNWESVTKFVGSLGAPPAGALYWMGYWLGRDAANKSPLLSSNWSQETNRTTAGVQQVSVPLALYDGSGGHIWNLELESVVGDGVRLFVHPESALQPVANDWLDALKLAAGQPRAKDKPAKPKLLKHAVCWRLRQSGSRSLLKGIICGESNGGAAARAFWHLMTDKHPDPGVLVMARVEPVTGWFDGEGWNPSPEVPPNLQLAAVDGIAPKVAAAVAAGMDTIAVVDDFYTDKHTGQRFNNAVEARNALPQDSSIRVVELQT